MADRRLAVHCPQCGSSGIALDNGQHVCGRCAAFLRVPGQFEIEVRGVDAREVQDVLHAAFHQAQSRMPMSQSEERDDSDRADIAILAALPKELDALFRSLGPWQRIPRPDDAMRTYHRMVDVAGHRIVAAQAHGMGQLNSALLARDVLRDWRPRKMILIGIAGGLGQDAALGDVVISEQVVDYELAKIRDETTDIRWKVYPCDASLLDGLRNFRDVNWSKRIAARRPDGRESTESRVSYGTVLSGNKVIADAATAGSLAAVWSRAAAVEMEAAGISAALHQYADPPGFVMIKGICDRADAAKNDEWQDYAAEAAATFLTSYLALGAPHSPVPQLRGEPSTRSGIAADLDLRELRAVIGAMFNMSELRLLMADIGVDHEEIPGEIKSVKVHELLAYLQRRGRIGDLMALLKKERPAMMAELSKHVP